MRILVVEDEHKIANSIKQGLEQKNFAVDVVYNGEDGYNLAIIENIYKPIQIESGKGGRVMDKNKSRSNKGERSIR